MNEELGVKIRPNESLDLIDVQRLGELYLSSFPPSERINLDQLIESVRVGERQLDVVGLNNEIVGFVCTYHLAGTSIRLMEYLAVDEVYQGRGIGSSLVEYLSRTYCQRARGDSGFIFEVEMLGADNESETIVRARRIKFYRKLGAKFLKCATDYRMPDLSGSGEVQMQLMYLPCAEGAEELKGQDLKKVVIQIYRQSYSRTLEDQLLQKVLSSFSC